MTRLEIPSTNTIFAVENVYSGESLSIPMAPISPAITEHGYTIFEIRGQGPEPWVDCKRTAEGPTEGPIVRFLGSIAAGQGRDFDPGSVLSGVIVLGHKLVVDHKGKKFVLPGLVHEQKTVSVFKKAKRKR